MKGNSGQLGIAEGIMNSDAFIMCYRELPFSRHMTYGQMGEDMRQKLIARQKIAIDIFDCDLGLHI